ncbi:hypothetical protein WJX74_007086 [Apatococcus lobatus]|uniref:Uncharacterized protein n=1 Tax=Apatococcus lobatus TaxID=904363 RepID=A0AAW1RM00_9CHLO
MQRQRLTPYAQPPRLIGRIKPRSSARITSCACTQRTESGLGSGLVSESHLALASLPTFSASRIGCQLHSQVV